jgi:hypothetical protein
MRLAARRLPLSPAAGEASRRHQPLAAERRSWLMRLIRRPEPTVFHRCLAVHIYHAAPRSALS